MSRFRAYAILSALHIAHIVGLILFVAGAVRSDGWIVFAGLAVTMTCIAIYFPVSSSVAIFGIDHSCIGSAPYRYEGRVRRASPGHFPAMYFGGLGRGRRTHCWIEDAGLSIYVRFAGDFDILADEIECVEQQRWGLRRVCVIHHFCPHVRTPIVTNGYLFDMIASRWPKTVAETNLVYDTSHHS